MIRPAAGGDEAAIWAGDLLRMYERYADRIGLEVEPLETSPSEAGGYDKVTVAIKGKGAYSLMKYEAGVHRVQRVPKTESQGGIHTSTRIVAVLPEVEEVEVDIDPERPEGEIVYCSTRPGGQSVNTTGFGRPAHPPPHPLSSPSRTRRASSRTKKRRCESSGPGCIRWNRSVSNPSWPGRAGHKWAQASVPRRFAPTTSRRIGSPTIAWPT